MRFLYSLFIALYSFGIFIASFFNEKAKFLQNGRKKSFQILEEKCENKKVIWFHCASLGEYEQGKPLIQKLRTKYSNCTFLVTFFSPSGYEVKKNDKDIDIAAYLPADSPRNARRFIRTVRPVAAFFVKYEYWYNYMKVLSDSKIPFYYLSAIFRPSQYFFKPYGRWFARQLRTCTHFFVQNETSAQLLRGSGIDQVAITGDTRFDRVFAIAQQQAELPFAAEFKGDKKLLVAGSSWQPDESVLAEIFPKIKNSYKLLIAPHVIDKEHINAIKDLFKEEKIVCFSEKDGKNLAEYNVLIVDTIGLLSKLYRYADVAMIGGAFATGLHNTLEAAVFGIPLFFGPEYAKFQEAVELVRRKGAFSIRTSDEMSDHIAQFETDTEFYQNTCQVCKDFVAENLGSCDKIMTYLPEL
ncbi:MAG: 3-deoxy-D-manno-octulosonic acid transferase [Bacteroidales bacterium]|nr:3-deoxy-D-manno-octulosonic acid transferase [Bacteroidales bacterium]